jgi:hypothetical protein
MLTRVLLLCSGLDKRLQITISETIARPFLSSAKVDEAQLAVLDKLFDLIDSDIEFRRSLIQG